MFEPKLDIVSRLISKSSANITSEKTKEAIRDLTESWKAEKGNYKRNADLSFLSEIEEHITSLEALSFRQHFEKSKALTALNCVNRLVRAYHLSLIEKTGSKIDENIKNKIRAALSQVGYTSVNDFLKDAEVEFTKPNYPEVCHHLRLAIEEYLRIVRERMTKTKVNGGTVGDHLRYFSSKNLIDDGDVKFIQGYHGFLCEKGSHSTVSRKRCDSDDAKFALMQTLNLIDFLITNGCY